MRPQLGVGRPGRSAEKARAAPRSPLLAEYAFAGLEGSSSAFFLGLLCSCSIRSSEVVTMGFMDMVVEMLGWVVGSGEAAGNSAASNDNRLDKIRLAIERAEAAGIHEDLLDTMRAKLEELELEVQKQHSIAVRDEETGATIAIVRSRSTDTLARLGEVVRQETGDFESALHFVRGGQALDNSWTVAEAGVSDGDVVSLVRTPLCWRSSSSDGTQGPAPAAAAFAWATPSAGASSSSAGPPAAPAERTWSPVLAATPSPCGRALFTRADNGEGKVWCLRSGALRCELSGQVVTGVFSADSKRLLGASDDCTARVWCTETGRCLLTLYGHADDVKMAVYGPDCQLIATASCDATACIWCSTTGQRIAACIGHQRAVNAVAFSPDGGTFVTASADATARIWRTSTGACERVLHAKMKALTRVLFSPCGSQILTVSVDGTLRLWPVSRGDCLVRQSARSKPVHAVAFSPDGSALIVASACDAVDVLRIESGDWELNFIRHADWVRSAVFSPDGSRLATASHDGTACLWDAVSGQCLRVLRGHTDWVGSVSFSADGRLVATASYDGTARVWEAATGECLHVLVGNTDWVRAASCSPCRRSEPCTLRLEGAPGGPAEPIAAPG